MIKLLLVGCAVLTIGKSNAQTHQPLPAVAVLQKTVTALNSFTKVSYRYIREMRYYENNYHNIDSAALYIEYIKNSPVGLRFQANRETAAFIYDGRMTLQLDQKGKTIDSATVKTAREMESNSFLYHSLPMLRNILPLIISNDSIQKSVSDTTISGQHFLGVKIEGPGIYFTLTGIRRADPPVAQKAYYLIVDKKTYLPFQFVVKFIRGRDDRDFVAATYAAINTRPVAPPAASWTYAAYRHQYRPSRREVKVPMVKAGDVVNNFRLPGYTPGAIDSVSLYKFAGKIVLLDFWFKSCGPCMEAMPHYNALQNKFDTARFQLLSINIEDGEADMKFFYNKYRPAYKMLYKGGEVFKRLGLPGCPSLVLLDKKGKVVQVAVGFDQQAIEKKIEEILTQN